MNIIISPAKKMNICNDDIISKSMPPLIQKTSLLYETLKSFSYENLKKILNCSDSLATLNFERYQSMDLYSNLTPAILAYEGLQYKYMSPNSFSDNEFNHASKHLKILSGFYGVLTPFDGVVPYRLEMQAKLKVKSHKDLYDFWGDSLYKEVTRDNNVILNLASKEYSKSIEKYLDYNDTFITCIFATLKDSKLIVKATEAKMARGLMVRYICENSIDNIEDIKSFSDLSFSYSKELSTINEYIFLKDIKKLL